ncbi:hypothetical protein O3M35_001493 [Rhynocoris fuscipes]|uniref:Prostaglandin reductase 1 n=1 Tax=Rhynocoris fuscipes TaxID=488301 RepID=A0AAW1CUE9_9HEMI
MVKNRKFIYAKPFEGEPKVSNFKLVEEELPALKDNEVHFEAVAISVDPYMRAIASYIKPGATMIGSQVAKVVESKHPNFKPGQLAVGQFGWQTNYIGDPDLVMSPFGSKEPPHLLPDFQGLSPSLGLGVLGMPGNTAYFGLLDLCKPKPGEVVVVTAAAGAVGSLVGQIAKIKGCKVIGFAGSDDKVEWLKKDLNFDYAFNYKKIDVLEALKQAAPDGVDCYFDNVGGVMASKIISCMRNFGRIACCGAISTYNDDTPPDAPAVQIYMIMKQLKMEGFLAQRWADRWFEGIKQNVQWVKEGKLKYKETVTKGFEKMPEAFICMLKGDSTGKAVIMV